MEGEEGAERKKGRVREGEEWRESKGKRGIGSTQTERQTDRETDRQRNRERQTDRETERERQRDKHTGRETDTYTCMLRKSHKL